MNLVDDVGAIDLLANRILWSVPVLLLILAVQRRYSELRAAFSSARTAAATAVAATLLTVNWGVWLFAVTNERIVEACRAARIHDTIAALPDGYDTVVGERGYRLSGGEKQRLAIARLLLKDPAVMILDEATSHLDNDNEAHVQASIETALHGRTALVIAHRLSTVRSADRIAVLDGGTIVEIGSHDELVDNDGLYAAQLRAGDLLTS